MPCALTEPENYPDYLKSILKEINVGDDDELKDCACKIISPVTNQGCLVVDEDGKVGGFPFCIAQGNNVGPTTPRPLGFSMKQIMRMYWLGFNIDIYLSVNTIIQANYCPQLGLPMDFPDSYVSKGNKEIDFIFNKTLKQKICLGDQMFHAKNYVITRWPESNSIQSTFDLAIYLDSSMVYKSDVGLFYPIILFGFSTGGGEYRATYINDNIGKSLGESIFYIEKNATILPNCWGPSDDISSCPPPNRVGMLFEGSLFLNSKININ